MLRKSEAALGDLYEVWLRIAFENRKAADELLDKIEKTLFLIGENPLIGREYVGKTKFENLRIFPASGFLIFYSPRDYGAYIQRVIHGAMDIDAELHL